MQMKFKLYFSDEETKEQRKVKQTLLIYYCKLIVKGIVPQINAVNTYIVSLLGINFLHIFFVMINFNSWKFQWSSEYGDIIKETIMAMLEKNKNNVFIVTNICLKRLFLVIIEKRGQMTTSGDHFFQVKGLAKHLASLLRSKTSTREYILKMHSNAIAFAFNRWNRSENEYCKASAGLSPPPNIQFLGTTIEFVKKLHPKDKQQM